MNFLKRFFGIDDRDNNKFDWELVEKHVAGFTFVNGKEVVRYMDIYQKFNPLSNDYEIKRVIYRTNCIFDNL